MIKKEELIKFQKELGLPLSTLEKDYALSLILWGLSQNPTLKTSWVFKGGTCLKKCYFPDYRFSEDLDFTLLPTASVKEADIRHYLQESLSLVTETFGLKIDVNQIVISPFPDKLFIQIKIPFQGPLASAGSLPRIKLDLSQEEILADPIEQMNLYHLYSDKAALQTTIPCYSIYELFAEKIRAFVERMRPRDLYDIVYLHDYFKDNHLQKEHLIHLLQIKFEHKSLKFPQHLQDVDPIKYETVKSDWDDMLGHQISNLQPIETYLPSVAKLISWLIS